jgi:molybdopterin synthase sulfur carrier subunit
MNINRFMEIKVLFFGVLAEVTQTMFRHYSDVCSFSDLKHRIEDEFPEIVHYDFRIAVNSELINDEPELKNNDEVAFMPPFAGG